MHGFGDGAIDVIFSYPISLMSYILPLVAYQFKGLKSCNICL